MIVLRRAHEHLIIVLRRAHVRSVAARDSGRGQPPGLVDGRRGVPGLVVEDEAVAVDGQSGLQRDALHVLCDQAASE